MAIKLADAFIFFKGDSSDLDKTQQQSEQQTRGWASRVGGVIQNAFGYALGTVAVNAVKQVGAAMKEWVLDASAAEGIERTFYGMADAAKLAELRAGSLGTVLDVDLMKNYNSAAISVSQTFADDLPDAMRYFGKISAATGEDIGYLMSSYTTGISRLSPMILDNLKIQVNQTEANRVYAASIGKTVDQLTKQEQQMALNAQVLALLEEKTRDMPDASESAAIKMQQLKTALGNTAMQIGAALLPAFVELLNPLVALANEYGPKVIEWAETAGEWLGENLPRAIGGLVSLFGGDIQSAISNFGAIIMSTFGPEATVNFLRFTDWLQTNIPIAVAKLSDVWTNVLSPAIQEVWGWIETYVFPLLEELGAWLSVNIPIAIQALSEFWVTKLWPAMQDFWNWVSTYVFPLLEELGAWLSVNIPIAIQALSEFWKTTLWPAMQEVWGWIETYVFPLIDQFIEMIERFPETLQIWASNWEAFKEILSLVWENIKTTVQNGIDAIVNFWSVGDHSIWEDISTIWGTIVKVIVGFLGVIVGALYVWWETFGGYWTQVWEGVKQILSNTWDTILAYMATVLDGLWSVLSTVWDSITTLIRNGLEIWRLLVNTFASILRGDWQQVWDNIKQIFVIAWDNLKTILENSLEVIKTVFTTGWDNIKILFEGSLKNIKAAFTSIDWGEVGGQIIDGIANGIRNGVSAISDAAKNAAKAALDAAKDFLGIESPSKAFELLGNMSVAGFVKPFEDMDAQPIEGALLRAVAPVVDGLRGTMYDQRRYEKHLHVTTVSNAENIVGDFALLGVMA